MTSEEQNEYLRKGLESLQAGNYFDAHEDWEIPWKDMTGHIRSFWQAMIQLSVGAYHYENQNLTGCRNLWNKALKRCDDILANGAAENTEMVLMLQKQLQDCLQAVAAEDDPLEDVKHFARETVSPAWYDFR